jgi:hypothetical protein
LKADHVIEVSGQIILPQLQDGICAAPGAGIMQPDRSHGSESQGFLITPCQYFHRETAFEILAHPGAHPALDRVFEFAQHDAIGRAQCIYKGIILIFIERTIDVVASFRLIFV